MANKKAIDPRKTQLKIVLTRGEMDRLKKDATLKGQSLCEYVRRAVFGNDYKEQTRLGE